MSQFNIGDTVWYYPVRGVREWADHRVACVIRSGPWTVGSVPYEATLYLIRRVDGSVITGGVCSEHLATRELLHRYAEGGE